MRDYLPFEQREPDSPLVVISPGQVGHIFMRLPDFLCLFFIIFTYILKLEQGGFSDKFRTEN
jgi:hypothetical protein